MKTLSSVFFLAAFTALPSAAHGQRALKPLVSHQVGLTVDSSARTSVPIHPKNDNAQRSGSHTRKDAVIGAVIGVAAGLIAGSQMGTGCAVDTATSCNPDTKRRNNMAATAAVGGVVGAGVGALIGLKR